MSTYYRFRCPVCDEAGGFFSRQAWGWGNCDIIDNFKFLASHVSQCNAKSLIIEGEHDERYWEDAAMTHLDGDYFPHSEDWKRVADEGKP